jgi:hypothetical protein
MNPFVYLFKYDDFRQGAMKLLRINVKVEAYVDGNSMQFNSTYSGFPIRTSTAVNTLKSNQLGSHEPTGLSTF